MGVRGAVYADGQLIVTDELELRPPGPHEVRVQVLSSGVCHSDVPPVYTLNQLAPVEQDQRLRH